jgi:hypothetical protein
MGTTLRKNQHGTATNSILCPARDYPVGNTPHKGHFEGIDVCYGRLHGPVHDPSWALYVNRPDVSH